ncbi:conserved hypothetical protein; putative signal peptide [Acinetobacter baylyi ADP1]|uniref:Uncharacterized protein n=2 Tax=Acinetobacter baylyi TaxID=202950 RepID=Q6FE28_ACIAD|nr:conserved hypothetical protein; putative signal peptide [Acinetobacter baylyi ADP1]
MVTMTTGHYTVSFPKAILTIAIGLGLSHSAFALEALSDETLSQQTGEGIAFLPENVKMVFQKAEDNLSGAQNTARMADRGYDTGLIRVIPVGPLSSTATASGAKKADLFIYGLALSKSDSNVNSRFSNTGVNLGTESNPWVLNVLPVSTYDFAGNVQSLSYLGLEAPLLRADGTLASDTAKLGLWGDIFSRNSTTSTTVNAATGAPDSLGGLENRLRVQMILNGLSLNGSNLKLFQTLGNATNNSGLSTTYNKTLGLAGLIRLNTDYNAGTRTTADSSRMLRISTAELTGTTSCSTTGTCLNTPAITGESAPNFNALEGVYIYSPNINLVLGSVYQPLIFNTDGNNFSLEVTRIPNVASIYQQIYTDYSGQDKSYKGSTCNVQNCGTTSTIAGVNYQGNTATHSSISIGTATIDNSNLLKAVNTSSAVGLTFKDSAGNAVNLGSAAIDGLMIQHLKISTTGL